MMMVIQILSALQSWMSFQIFVDYGLNVFQRMILIAETRGFECNSHRQFYYYPSTTY